ncbi:MAG: RNA methyltransferase [Balneolaceae bacterium]|nr:RNA methyltransferase [Balneolaceae bacterium]MBO6546239.1 RNA methyltransferase [Balneolaceae bacterium]MBO6648598.1 RNA methyltransferase [Balneolaceae bacterium]
MHRKLTTKEILEENLAQSPPSGLSEVKVILHNIRSLHNVGSTFRSCDAFGVSELILSGYTPRPPRPEINKTAIGAEEFVKWSNWDDVSEMCSSFKKEGYTLVGLEQTTNSIQLPDFDAKAYPKLCLIMGNEVTGIDDDILPFIDEFISIPQFGQKHSLNVSVAAGVMLYALLEKLW